MLGDSISSKWTSRDQMTSDRGLVMEEKIDV